MSNIQLCVVRASEKNTIAKVTFAFVSGAHESEVSLVTPVGKQATLYVSAAEKVRFIADMRAALDAWEKTT